MEIFIFWFVFSIVVGVIAAARGRSGLGYFLLSLIITPLLAVILVALLPKRDPYAPMPHTHVRCPDCKELVLNEARVCKHCGCKLVPVSEQNSARVSVPPANTLG